MIISCSGRIKSGKDLVGRIIQCLTVTNIPNEDLKKFILNNKIVVHSDWHIKKFANKLKDIVCLLTGCTRKQLEDQEFKSKELSEEWWYYRISSTITLPRFYYPYEEDNKMCEERFLIKPTYRSLLQQIGTDLFRDKLHPNCWVSSLMNEYKTCDSKCQNIDVKYCGDNKYDCIKTPNWIITDLRFPNELKAVKDRGGISIRVKRSIPKEQDVNQSLLGAISNYKEHPSETALDDAVFNYEINNTGTIEELIEKVREILIKENIT